MHSRLATLVRAAAWGYLAAVATFLVALAAVGEASWLSTVLLYVPRAPLALPLVLLVPALVRVGPRWLLLTQLAASLLIAWPLMGLRLGSAVPASPPSLTLMSWNVWYGRRDLDAVVREIEARRPDVVLLQSTNSRIDALLQRQFGDWRVRSSSGFTLLSRHPIVDLYEPPMLTKKPWVHSGWVRYTVETPLGLLDVYNVHLHTPRSGLYRARERLPQMLSTGDAGGADENVAANTAVRRQQVERLLDDAARARHPVVIAGDTNLPGLSALLRPLQSHFTDGWSAVGRGFGYTFPANHLLPPWMRIDRVLVGPDLRFARIAVGGSRGSDHYPVIAEIFSANR
jgi:endonuclease/exonuclease/phosphatase (EEP) superfamily protein YafD